MRVLHIFNELEYSGAEIMYVTGSPYFKKNDLELYALSTGVKFGRYKEEFDKSGYQTFHRPLPDSMRSPIAIYKYFKEILSFLRTEKIEVVHIHRAAFFWFFALVSRIAGIKSIRTIHNVFRYTGLKRRSEIIQRFTARNYFNTTFHSIGESVYYNEQDYFKNKTIRINNWYDSNKFFSAQNLSTRNEIRNQLGIDTDAIVIVSTGSCSKVKNHKDIIKALSVLNKSIACVYLHLGCGELEQQEKDLASQLHIADKVRFLGNRKNVRDYLISSDIYIMPSLYEGLSIAAIEAMACGLPSVLYNSPGLRDLIQDDNNGFLVNNNFHQLVDRVLYYYNNPESRKLKGSSAEAFVQSNFNIEQCTEEIYQLYKAI